MANIPCTTTPSLCQDPANPIRNLSSEDPDVDLFYKRYYGDPIPPIGDNSYWNFGCLGICTSDVSQMEADACAQAQALICANGDDGGGGGSGGGGVVRQIFFNTAQCCGADCGDGTYFSYCVRAGLFAGYSQEQANEVAHSYACNLAGYYKVCLSDLDMTECCVDGAFSALIDATGAFVSEDSNYWELVSGALPPGLYLFYDDEYGTYRNQIGGVPEEGGEYHFTIRVTLPNGSYMQKDYVICIIDIDSDPDGDTDLQLPDADINQPYTCQLILHDIPVPYTGCGSGPLSWQVVSGSLPAGLTLDETTGEISGTPTIAGDYIFTIGLQTEAS